jgi:hypothetical protein
MPAKVAPRSWDTFRKKIEALLEKRTGEGLAAWNAKVARQKPKTKEALRVWLSKQGVDGYPQTLLVLERFGYPDYLTASADELIDAQYEKRPALRPVYDKVIGALTKLGDVEVQARKTYVSILTPRRTFARVQASKDRVQVALRLEGRKPGGLLERSNVHDDMPVQISFTTPKDVSAKAVAVLREAYEESL